MSAVGITIVSKLQGKDVVPSKVTIGEQTLVAKEGNAEQGINL